MSTVRFKGTVVGSGKQLEGIPNPPGSTTITIQGNPTLNPNPGNMKAFYTNVAAAITALGLNGAASIYITTLAGDITAIEGAVTIVPASNQD